jgi:hypothetical protein
VRVKLRHGSTVSEDVIVENFQATHKNRQLPLPGPCQSAVSNVHITASLGRLPQCPIIAAYGNRPPNKHWRGGKLERPSGTC